MKLQILQTHIKDGIRKTSDKCPIALALLDAGWDCADVNVNIISCRKGPATWKYFHHSHQSQIFMQHFDSGLAVIPMEVELLE